MNAPAPTRPASWASRGQLASWLVTLLVVGIGAWLLHDLLRSHERERSGYSQCLRSLELLGDLQYHTQEARRTLLYALATTDSNRQVDYADQSRAAEAQVARNLAEYRRLAQAPDDLETHRKLETHWADYLLVRDELIASMLEGNARAAVELDLAEGIPAFNVVRQDLNALKSRLQSEASVLLRMLEAESRGALLRLAIILALTLVCALVVAKSVQKSSLLRAVQASEARLRQDLESITEEVIVLDAAGRVVSWNSAAAASWSIPREAILGRPLLETLPGLAATPLSAAIITALERTQGRVLEELTVDHRGVKRCYVARVFPFQGGVSLILGDITARKDAETELAALHERLLAASRQAGMAEVAIGVLHNVGNVLNSVNVSATLVNDRLRESKLANLGKAAALLREYETDLPAYLVSDPKGRLLPGYLVELAEHLAAEQAELTREIALINKNVGHIKEVVALQQGYARSRGFIESLAPDALVEHALQINAAAFLRSGIQVTRLFEPSPPVWVDRHKALQILVNLLRNARQAEDQLPPDQRRVTVAIARHGGDRVKITVQDNGVGIAPENLTRIFNHGFTTKPDGHGFGLHSGALAAREMGGSLAAHSDGPGRGAIFTLELPITPQSNEPA